MERCKAIILTGSRKGQVCRKLCLADRCKVHSDSIKKHGQIKIGKQEANAAYNYRITLTTDSAELEALNDARKEKIKFYESLRQEQWDDNGADPEFAALMEWRTLRHERLVERQQRRRIRHHYAHDEPMPLEPEMLLGELEAFTADAQNVHTEKIVNQTTKNVSILLKTFVPEEFRWNAEKCSKTPGDIIMKCNLPPDAVWQMVSKYCANETIYDLEIGIYGKVLDAVWQLILVSDDKTNLMNILKIELVDNIGMCAQGNLSRLCNIMTGYIDGIQIPASVTEMLGESLPKLLVIADIDERIIKAIEILKNSGIPHDQWSAWLEPLKTDSS